MLAELYLTDGITRVNLIGSNRTGYGIGLDEVRFSRAKRESNFSTSLSQSFGTLYASVQESYRISITGLTQNEAIAYQQSLDRILVQAENYFNTSAEGKLVWLVSKALKETNPRYAVVYGGALDAYSDLYEQPFIGVKSSVMVDLDLALTRGVWLENPPTTPESKPITNTISWYGDLPTWLSQTVVPAVTNGYGLYRVQANNLMFAGYDSVISKSTDNGANWASSKALSAGNVAYQFIEAHGKLYAAVGRLLGANADSGIWSATLTGGSWTQELSGVNYFCFALQRTGNRLLAGGTAIVRIKDPGGAWNLFASTFNGNVRAMTIHPLTGTLIIGDRYDVYRVPYGGGLNLVSTVPSYLAGFVYAISFDTRILLGSYDQDALLSLDDGVSFSYVDGGGYAAYHSPNTSMLYRTTQLGIKFSADEGASWTAENIAGGYSIGGQLAENATGSLFLIDAGRIMKKSLETISSGPLTAGPVYVANRFEEPTLSHLQVFDAAPAGYTVLSGNVDTVNGSNLLPAVVAIGDILYIGGMDPSAVTARVPSMSSIYFELTVSNKTQTYVYEYWNGAAWAAFTETVDQTLNLRRSGLLSFRPPSSWTSSAVNGITKFWLRIRVTAIADSGITITTPPRAINVYSPMRNYFEVSGIQGDIPALAQLKVTNVNQLYGGGVINWTQTNALTIGLRSVDRGPKFNPFLQPDGAALTHDGGLAGNGFYVPAAITVGSFATAATYTIFYNLTDYAGVYRVYLRYAFYGIDQSVTLKLTCTSVVATQISEEVILSTVATTPGYARLLDLGQFSIGTEDFLDVDETGAPFLFTLSASALDAAQVVNCFELVLMPIDEWVGYFEDTSRANPLDMYNALDIDSASYFKRQLRANVRYGTTQKVTSAWQPSATGALMLQPRRTQRFYFLSEAWNGEYMACPFTQVHKVQLYAHERFLGGRGNG